MSGHTTRHDENLGRLARIEGQVRGVQRMVEDGAYCIDILTQLQAVQSALRAVSRRILHKHLEHCVTGALKGKDSASIEEKMSEIKTLIERNMR